MNFSSFSPSPNESKIVTIESHPVSAGPYNETFFVTCDPPKGDNRANVVGTAHAPRALTGVYPSGIHDHGKLAKGSPSDFSFTIGNGSEVTLAINSLEESDKPEFTIISMPPSIRSPSTGNLQVCFTPSSDNDYSYRIILHSNAENASECNIPLKGKGYLSLFEGLSRFRFGVSAIFGKIGKLFYRR